MLDMALETESSKHASLSNPLRQLTRAKDSGRTTLHLTCLEAQICQLKGA